MIKLLTKENDGTFTMPRPEAKKLAENKILDILFEIDTPHIEGSNIVFDMDFYSTEVQFPCSIVSSKDRERKIFSEAVFDAKIDTFNDGSIRKTVLNACTFWNLLGDGTHNSQLVPTPFFFTKGSNLVIENKYNVPKIKCVIHDIEVIRDNNMRWFWKLSLKKA